MSRDRNLLFGILALQLKQVTTEALVQAAKQWATDPSCDIADILQEAGTLTSNSRTFVDEVVNRLIEGHGDDSTLTLNAFGVEEQVYVTYQGTITLTPSGGVSTVTIPFQEDGQQGGHIPGVQETPGRYTHISEYGRGGMGRVLLAHDEHLGRDIALKELLPHPVSGSPGQGASPVRLAVPHVARFLQEARITGQLEHPAIVPVYELGYRRDGTLYYTMKLVRGKTLSQAIREAGSFQERMKLLSHFLDLCNAIAYAHSRGVIHRDLKPGNVMVGEF